MGSEVDILRKFNPAEVTAAKGQSFPCHRQIAEAVRAFDASHRVE